MNTVPGKRIADGEWPGNPGEYSKHLTEKQSGEKKVVWFCIPPKPGIGCGSLENHTVTEHADGTITVSPSILISGGRDGLVRWHGYLEKGIWREC